jgi:uncharacterized membrane protein YkvA (DUF1232 family)
MKNRFYDKAYKKASALRDSKERIVLLLTSLSEKLSRVKWKSARLQKARQKLIVLSKLVKSYINGQYREIPWKAIVSILASIIYFINPFDLIPDVVPIIGFTDDISVLLWVYNSVSDEIEKYLEWEKSQLPTS